MHRLNVNRNQEFINESAYLAGTATVLGEVHIGAESSVWFGAVIRGDSEQIKIGDRSNIQDLCVIHADPGFPTKIGDDVTIGHGAIVHGATIENGAMVGIKAVVLNGARVEAGALVGAGAIVTEGTLVPAGHLAVGVPAKIVAELKTDQIDRMKHAANHYVAAAREYKTNRKIDA